MATVQEKATRLLELRKKLSRYQEELKELRTLESEFSADALALIEAMGEGKSRKQRQTAMGEADPKVWARIKSKYFAKGNTATIDAKARQAIAEEAKVDLGVVNATLAEHCDGAFAGPKSGKFTLR